MKTTRILLIAAIFISVTSFVTSCDDDNDKDPENPLDMPYNVVIDPADFESTNITGNDFFPLTAGRTLIYEGEDEDGAVIRVEEEYTDVTKVIMGVTCVTVIAKEYEDGELVEDTDDWYAQDMSGNVWYFGEESEEIEDGVVVSTEGSWEAGVAGALPGILMLANPIEGLWYRQEYWENEAEDVAQVLSLNASVTVPFGSFSDCLQTAEWNPLEPGIVEHKFYAAGVGLLKAQGVKGESDIEELVSIIED